MADDSLQVGTQEPASFNSLTDSNNSNTDYSNTAAGTRGKPTGLQSEAFEAFHLLRTYLNSQLTDLREI